MGSIILTTMSEPQLPVVPDATPTQSTEPPATTCSALTEDPAIAPAHASEPSVTVCSPIYRDYIPTRLTPSFVDGQEPVRQSSRLKREEVYDFNAPVVLHEWIDEKGVADEEVLKDFGFALCDGDTLWYHPHAQFECQSRDEVCCKWPRDSITRCSITTEINRIHETGVHVKDLDSLASLHHPQCVNEKCKWGNNPKHIMRLEKGQLVTRQIASSELFALRSRQMGKWYGQCQDVYPRAISALPFSKAPSAEPVKRRVITLSNASGSISVEQPPAPSNDLPISPESQPQTPAPSTTKKVRKRKRSTTEVPHRRPAATPGHTHVPDSVEDGIVAERPGEDNPFNDEDDFTDGSVLRDHLLISKRRYDWDRAKSARLEMEIDQARQETTRQSASIQRLELDVEQVSEQLANAEESGRLALAEKETEIKAVKEEVDRQNGFAKEWRDVSQKALTARAGSKVTIGDLQEKENAAKNVRATLEADKAVLEKENADLKAALSAEKARAEDLVNQGRQFFERMGKKCGE